VSRAALLCALATPACIVEGSLGKDLPDTTTTSGASTGVHDASTSGGNGSTDHGTGTCGSTDAAASDSGTHGTGQAACEPGAEDDACSMCTKASCCDALVACQMDPICSCVHACHASGTPLPDCTAMCGDDGGLNATLEQCTHDLCAAVCA